MKLLEYALWMCINFYIFVYKNAHEYWNRSKFDGAGTGVEPAQDEKGSGASSIGALCEAAQAPENIVHARQGGMGRQPEWNEAYLMDNGVLVDTSVWVQFFNGAESPQIN